MLMTSLESLRQNAAAAFRRFPVPLACAWAACASFDIGIFASKQRFFTAGLLLALGIPLAFAATLRGERFQRPSFAVRWLPHLVILAILAVLIAVWPSWPEAIQQRRYAQLSLFVHALVAFFPYLGVREPNGFWQYNRTLLERFVLASIFAGVLLAGVMGAIGSLRPLFGVHVSPKVFQLVPTWVALLFHPWFFLAGIPADLAALEERRDYPGTVKIFAQFILVPLVAIYQALLTGYLVKVVITGKWPSGIIGWLVSAEAVAGILALLLVHPVRDRVENLWVRTFSRVFYIALLPSIVMLGLAIAKRVGQYGITPDRYFVIALTAWLAGISVYFIARRDGDLRWIPISLAAVAVITFGGPWGAYGASRSSQHARLMHLLEANGMWKDGQFVRPPRELSYEARRDLSSDLDYLLQFHGTAGMRPELATVMNTADSGFVDPEHIVATARAGRAAQAMGFVYVEEWDRRKSEDNEFTWQLPQGETPTAIAVGAYRDHARVEAADVRFDVGPRTLRLWSDAASRRFILADVHAHGPDHPYGPVDTLATAAIDTLIAATRAQRLPGSPLPHVDLVGRGARGTLYVSQLRGNKDPHFLVFGLTGDLFFTLSPADSSD